MLHVPIYNDFRVYKMYTYFNEIFMVVKFNENVSHKLTLNLNIKQNIIFLELYVHF